MCPYSLRLGLVVATLWLSVGISAAPPARRLADVVPAPSPSAARAAFEAADVDHDGFISLAEFHKNALLAWHTLDTNRDGWIDLRELSVLPQVLRVSLLGSLKRADSDGDLKLSFKEVMNARMADFDAADTNRDDRLSLAEVLAFEAAKAQARR